MILQNAVLWTSTDIEAFTALDWLSMSVSESGLSTPSLRAITGGRCSPGTLINWFGSKAEMHRRVVRTLGVKWGHVLRGSLVPVKEHHQLYARMRLAYDELARSDVEVAAELDELVKMERKLIAGWIASTHKRVADPRLITVLHALLVRLWDTRVHPDPRPSMDLLEDFIDGWLGEPVLKRPYVMHVD